jgi:hypothetical protein
MPALVALWWAGKDDWNKARGIVMNHDDPNCAEGDLSNARYWYRQAARSPATNDLAAEWAAIAVTPLAS